MTEFSALMNEPAFQQRIAELKEQVEELGQVLETDLLLVFPEAEGDEELQEQIRQAVEPAENADAESDPSNGGSALAGPGNEPQSVGPKSRTGSTADAVDLGDSLGAYFSQVGRIPLLTKEEEIELAKRLERGAAARSELAGGHHSLKQRRKLIAIIEDGLAAREHLILANSRLVVSVAKKYSNRGIPLQDLIQEGHIGLMRAVKKFDYRRGFKFSTYATWWIRQAVSRWVADQGRTIRIPVHMSDKIRKMVKARSRLTQEMGSPPALEQLANELETEPKTISRLIQYSRFTASLDEPIGDDDDNMSLGEAIEDEHAPIPEDAADEGFMEQDVRRALEHLKPREARILRMRHGIATDMPLSLEEIGNRIGITRERVRQIEANAMRRLRASGHRKDLLEHLTS